MIWQRVLKQDGKTFEHNVRRTSCGRYQISGATIDGKAMVDLWLRNPAKAGAIPKHLGCHAGKAAAMSAAETHQSLNSAE